MRRITTFLNEHVGGLLAINPWSNVLGLARTFLALGTLLTLLFNPIGLLFPTVGGEPASVLVLNRLTWLDDLNFFMLLGYDQANLMRWLAMGILLLVISGWQPRVTAILHWWVAYSFYKAAFLIDGGDQLTSILTLLLIPVCLMDPRPNHWHATKTYQKKDLQQALALVTLSVFWIIRFQVATLYFHAGEAKMGVEEWADGTAVYYWFTDTFFGMPAWLSPVLMPVLTHSWGVQLLTWGTIIFELTLFLGLVMPKKYRGILLVLGICFHFGIILVHGLVSFFFAISAGLILYLRPLERPFAFRWAYRLRSVLLPKRWLSARPATPGLIESGS